MINVSTLKRIWHKFVPTDSPKLLPSSVQFCEANVLIGRNDDQAFELVQIVEPTHFLSSISFKPSGNQTETVPFLIANYDSARRVLLVSVPSQKALYSYKYNDPPIKRDTQPVASFGHAMCSDTSSAPFGVALIPPANKAQPIQLAMLMGAGGQAFAVEATIPDSATQSLHGAAHSDPAVFPVKTIAGVVPDDTVDAEDEIKPSQIEARREESTPIKQEPKETPVESPKSPIETPGSSSLERVPPVIGARGLTAPSGVAPTIINEDTTVPSDDGALSRALPQLKEALVSTLQAQVQGR